MGVKLSSGKGDTTVELALGERTPPGRGLSGTAACRVANTSRAEKLVYMYRLSLQRKTRGYLGVAWHHIKQFAIRAFLAAIPPENGIQTSVLFRSSVCRCWCAHTEEAKAYCSMAIDQVRTEKKLTALRSQWSTSARCSISITVVEPAC